MTPALPGPRSPRPETAPQTARGSWLGRRLQRLGLPRPLSLGAGDAFVRPLRGLLTALAIVIGVASLTFAYGLHGTLLSLCAGS